MTNYSDETCSISACGSVVVCVWRDAPRADHLRRLSNSLSQLATRLGHQVALLNVVVRGTPNFAEDAREEAARAMATPRAVAAAHVVELPGLAGTATRMFIGGSSLLSRSKSQTKTFADVGEGAAWLCGLLRDAELPAPREAELVSAIDGIRNPAA